MEGPTAWDVIWEALTAGAGTTTGGVGAVPPAQTRILPFKVADHLGLTRGTETLSVRELAFEREGHQHGIYKSVAPGDDRIILAFRTPEKRWTAFVTDTQFRLASAIVWNAGETPVTWPNAEALPAFNNELTYWSVIADLL